MDLSNYEVQNNERTLTRFSGLVYKLLHANEEGKELMDELNKRYLSCPTWAPGQSEANAIFRAGQNNVIHYLNHVIESVKSHGDKK